MKLQYQTLIARLSPTDLVAEKAKYHTHFQMKLYNDSRKTEVKGKNNIDINSHGISLVELMSYIKDIKNHCHRFCIVREQR